jgi:hypothetical protein
MGKYMSLYANDFSSQGMDRNAWRKEKGEINKKKSWIRIELRDVSIGEPVAGNRVEVRFQQDYRSSNFSGSSRKVLLLMKTDPGWRIVLEKSG